MINSDIYQKNIEILQKKQPHLIEYLNKIEKSNENYLLTPTKNNSLTLKVKKDDQFYFLHSQYNPQSESNSIIEKLIQDKYDIIFCGGFGLGFFIQSFFNLKYDDFSKLIIIEKDINIFKKALEVFDFSKILNDDKIKLLFEEDNDIPGLNEILINSVTKKVYTFIPPVYLKIYPDFYLNLKNLIDSYLSRKNINIATLSRFQKLWTRNIIKNHKLFLKNKGIINFFNQFNDIPCMVISAGPSLSDNLSDIKKNQNKFIIIAVDSIFQTLLKNDIVPDIVVTVDPQYINYKYFEYNTDFNPILVAESSTFPLILNHYKGRLVFFSSVFALAKWFEQFTEKKGEIDMGGSVSTTAFDLACKLGTNPIILFGQDLAFIKNRTHTKGSYVEKYWALRYNKFNTSLNGAYKYIHNNLFIKIKSNNDKLVNTDKRLMIFLVWFKNKMRNLPSHIRVYNTSQDGAKIDRMIVKNFKEILNEYQFKDIKDIKNQIYNFYPEIKNIDYNDFLKHIEDLKSNLNQLEKIISESLELSQKLYNIIDKNKNINMKNILNKLDKNDKSIHKAVNLTDFLSMTIQDKIHTILEDYESHLNEKEKNNNDLKTAKKSIFLYSGIFESIQLFKVMFKLI